MLDIKEAYTFDEELENTGVWIDIGDAKLLIARSGNDHFAREWNKVPRTLRAQMEQNAKLDDAGNRAFSRILAKAVLLGWENVGEDGKSIPYSKQAAEDFMYRYPRFRGTVWSLSNEGQLFQDQSVEEDSKNSESASSGNSSTQAPSVV